MIKHANRLDSVEEYYFSKKLREVSKMIASGEPVINMGIGSPDLYPSKIVIDEIKSSLSDQVAHKYQSYQGIYELRKSISNFYKKYFNVEVNPDNQVLPLMGSKEGIMHISLAFLNPGDEVLIPNPGYPTYLSVTKLVEAKPRFYNLSLENKWFPDIEELEKLNLSNVKIMWVNYPHMPTGASASKQQFEQLIDFAKKHNILIINDNPYSFILNDNHTSLLSIDNSKEVAMELNSLSKSFNMSGWRVGMLLGSSENISRVLKVKSNMDSGMFYGVQKGAIAALNLDKSWFDKLNIIYTKRRELIWKIADVLNCTYDKNSKGLFIWAKLPDEIKDSEKFIDYLLNEKKIFVAPGTIFGSEGQGYIRFSLCIDESIINEALKRLEE
ncbi:aminotransferase class I/II-fold pyridoxal phosphate-dependent enzyme [Flavobacteriaceae bacterium]|nr:aminotransferase class I/II-fold pyridoxal phosphate-dependent enzyme [Flavobacteriaceae bacterium]MDB4023639.1 aminotransferase class I/II-fold pyridoxal phosphate-dependent enzyme [Flavobacteriaceae bacterium]MDB4130886.1 aminotransferase class I/II-fold pyridoxal phosphate-dependent enzyme [Flavobacteriaceae bacterium]MDB9871623.1 aminotransferase class I/II-fold pyridoxal phosphate-dependent enzyme [bacterium]MDC0592930.1 aminotransferase class I/II-fold pyridoxal phosphate-dependent enz